MVSIWFVMAGVWVGECGRGVEGCVWVWSGGVWGCGGEGLGDRGRGGMI